MNFYIKFFTFFEMPVLLIRPVSLSISLNNDRVMDSGELVGKQNDRCNPNGLSSKCMLFHLLCFFGQKEKKNIQNIQKKKS